MFIALGPFFSRGWKHNPKFKAHFRFESWQSKKYIDLFSRLGTVREGKKKDEIWKSCFSILSIRPFHSVTPFFHFARMSYRTSTAIKKEKNVLKRYFIGTKINIFGFYNRSSFFLNQRTDVGLLRRKYSSAFVIYKTYLCAFCIITNCFLACNLNLTSFRSLYTFLFIAEF